MDHLVLICNIINYFSTFKSRLKLHTDRFSVFTLQTNKHHLLFTTDTPVQLK